MVEASISSGLPGDDFALLQARYPRALGKQGYVPRADMTEKDWEWNVMDLDDKITGHAGSPGPALSMGNPRS